MGGTKKSKAAKKLAVRIAAYDKVASPKGRTELAGGFKKPGSNKK
jgi:hypothetical protein